MFDWQRLSPGGYECSTAGDTRFSALNARLADGRTIEEAYQLDVKGYRVRGNDWRLGKGKRPLLPINAWESYLSLWRQWARENPQLMEELRSLAKSRVLTDRFAQTGISQARALAHLLNETPVASESAPSPDANTQPEVRECAGTVPATQLPARAPGRR